MNNILAFLILILAVIYLSIYHYRVLKRQQKERENMETFKNWIAKKATEAPEQRCQHCLEKPDCPGYDTGVKYPCEYYVEDNRDGKE